MKRISFVMPTRNNLKYLKWAINSIRKNSNNNHYICVADDASIDGTKLWCEEYSKQDKNFKFLINYGPNRMGHTLLYDEIVKQLVDTDIFIIFHADMYLCPNALDYIEKYIQPKTVVSLTRIEPPLHPTGPEKITEDFGIEPELFDENKFLEWFNKTKSDRKDKTTEGIFAPWAIYKDDFLSIGGHDKLYAPQSKEDSDIFNRFLLNGYKFIQTWGGCVYHMTCRGSRFNPSITTVGKESNEWLKQNEKSARNFIRKWGSFVGHDNFMKPIIPPKYDVSFIVDHCNDINIIYAIEPWCSTLYLYDQHLINNYIKLEQPNTNFDLSKKIKLRPSNIIEIHDITVKFEGYKLNNDNFQIITNLSNIIHGSGEVGIMEYDIFTFDIKSLQTYENKLININDEYYQNQLIKKD